MSKPMSPRGPLPAQVYWVRRAGVLVIALLLVFGIARLLAAFGGSDGGSGQAVTAAQQTVPSVSYQPGAVLTPRAAGKQQVTGPLSQPTGDCDDADVLVQPNVTDVPGGGVVKIGLLATTDGATCTWKVSAKSLVVSMTDGGTRLWSSQDCPSAIPDQQVVVRPADEPASRISITWRGHRSVTGCVGGQPWVDPGWYHLMAASLGGDPSDAGFRVTVPDRPVITKTPTPTTTPTSQPSKKPSKKPSAKPSKKPSAQASKKPTATPTGKTD